MNEYLIIYGANNEMATFHANDPNQALDAFDEWNEDEDVEAEAVYLLVKQVSRID